MSIPILTILFALILRSAGKKKGITSARVWLFPLLVGGLFYALCIACLVFERWFDIIGNEKLRALYALVVQIAISLLLTALTFKTWRQIASLPDR